MLRKRRKQDSDTEETVGTPPKFPLLESVAHRFDQNRKEQQERVCVFKTRREVERSHARYVQEGVGYTLDLLQAKCTANYWAKKNGVKDDPFTSRSRSYPVPATSSRNKSPVSSSPNNRSARSSVRQSTTSNQSAATSAQPSTSRNTSAAISVVSVATTSNSVSTATRLSATSNTPATIAAKTSAAGNKSATTSVMPATATSSSITTPISSANANKQSANTSLDSPLTINSQSPDMGNQSGLSGASLTDGSFNREGISENTANVSNTSDPRSRADSLDVISLDLTADDSLVFVPDTELSQSINRSNNADTRRRSKNSCKVLSCDAKFSSAGALGQHMNLFKHSPCNPCLKASNCKLSPDPLCFVCPECDREFQTSEECSDHMKVEKHLQFYPPLSIAGYMCAQCLYVFEDFAACWQHIEESSHRDICYPFADDLSSNTAGVGPVAIVRELVDDLVKKCNSVSFTVQCLECSLEINSPAVLRQHMLETNNQHVVSSLCDSNLVDVFAGYLAGYSCNKCKRLFNGDMKNGAKHDCARNLIGTIIENDVLSFFDFVKRCALTLIKSLEIKDTSRQVQPKPGPSHCGRESARGAIKGPASNLRSNENAQLQVELISSDEESDDDDDTTEDDEEDCVIIGVEKRSATAANSPGATRSARRKRKKRRQKQKKLKAQAANSGLEVTNMAPNDRVNHSGQAANSANISGPTNTATLQTTTGNQFTSQSTAGSQNTGQLDNSTRPLLPPPTVIPPLIPPHLGMPPLLPNPIPPHLPLPNPAYPPPLLPVGSHTHVLPPPLVNPHAFQPYGTRLPFYTPNTTHSQAQAASRHNAGNQLQVPRAGPRSRSPVNVQADCRGATGNRLQVPVSNPGTSRDRSRSRSPINGQKSNVQSRRERSRSPMDTSIISTPNLSRMKNIIFLDLDNWCSFFTKLPRVLPDLTFVWGFYGGRLEWNQPYRCYVFKKMKDNGQFYLNEKCGYTKDAADFAIVLTVGKMDERLPNDVAFTILSGDTGFMEVERQMKNSERKAVVINPHQAEKFSNEMIYTMVTSVTDT